MQLFKYISNKTNKTVMAAKIDKVEISGLGVLLHFTSDVYPIPVSREYIQHPNLLGGYYVLDAVGHESFSPAKEFEEDYSKAEGCNTGKITLEQKAVIDARAEERELIARFIESRLPGLADGIGRGSKELANAVRAIP